MRKLAAIAAGLGALACVAAAQPESSAAVTAAAAETLGQRIPEINFTDAPLDQVMEYVKQVSGLNVVVRWAQLEADGIDRDKPITVTARGLRLSQVLWLIMTEAGGGEVKLAYRASGNLLVISTAADLGKEMIVRVYDVSDLLLRIPNFRSAPQIDFSQASQNLGTQGGGGGQNIFGGQGGGQQQDDEARFYQQQQPGQVDPEVQQLINLIVTTIEPDSWAVAIGQAGGQGLGTIQAWRKQLVVRNNILVHQLLGGAIESEE